MRLATIAAAMLACSTAYGVDVYAAGKRNPTSTPAPFASQSPAAASAPPPPPPPPAPTPEPSAAATPAASVAASPAATPAASVAASPAASPAATAAATKLPPVAPLMPGHGGEGGGGGDDGSPLPLSNFTHLIDDAGGDAPGSRAHDVRWGAIMALRNAALHGDLQYNNSHGVWRFRDVSDNATRHCDVDDAGVTLPMHMPWGNVAPVLAMLKYANNPYNSGSVDINSDVVSISILDSATGNEVSITEVSEWINISMTVTRGAGDGQSSAPRCVYWDVSTTDWKDDGCWVSGAHGATVNCSCSHLTDFAVTYSPPASDKAFPTALVAGVVGGVGGALVLAAVVALIVTANVRSKRRAAAQGTTMTVATAPAQQVVTVGGGASTAPAMVHVSV